MDFSSLTANGLQKSPRTILVSSLRLLKIVRHPTFCGSDGAPPSSPIRDFTTLKHDRSLTQRRLSCSRDYAPWPFARARRGVRAPKYRKVSPASRPPDRPLKVADSNVSFSQLREDDDTSLSVLQYAVENLVVDGVGSVEHSTRFS